MTSRLRSSRGLRILPSATTVLAICAGLTSIKYALDGRPHVALALIGAAAVLDGIDGGIARALHAQSPMGAEIDSLADAVNFGVAGLISPIVGWISKDAGITATTMASVMVGCATIGILSLWLIVRPRTVAMLTP